MLYLAMSCLQARPQIHSYLSLKELNPDGIQLTPGNIPNEGFSSLIDLPYRFHHGFSWDKYRRDVYDEKFCPINIGENHSIHPPKKSALNFDEWIENVGDYIFEIMYPGYYLGNDYEVNKLLDLHRRIAVDISHIFICKTQGTLTNKTINRIFDYDNICEIHVSHNNGKHDTHRPIDKNTPFLSFIKERKIPIVYESYMHRLQIDERKEQISIIREFIK